MRERVKLAGVRILDHRPALELLVDADGAVATCARPGWGTRRKPGAEADQTFRVLEAARRG
ncbi:hypothetical protein [Sorangium sp. So ce233]|uniref:hypothetical protein n=1 Tax=Sorangium sp. So ce233 TaxID=3133290 RepID=UPI003F5D8F0E